VAFLELLTPVEPLDDADVEKDEERRARVVQVPVDPFGGDERLMTILHGALLARRSRL
jgi:hypothetical protein